MRWEHVLCYFITGTQEKKLEGAKVHTEGRPCFYALLWPYKGKYIDLYKNRIRIYFPHIIFLGLSSCLLLSPLCQGDDPLGSIHLRGSVVTAVEFVPDGEWDCCHRKHMSHVASSLTSCDRKIYMILLFTINSFSPSHCFQPIFCKSFTGFSQKIRRWRQPLWDNHLRWDSLLPSSRYCWRKKGVDQSSAGSVKKWKVTAGSTEAAVLCMPAKVESLDCQIPHLKSRYLHLCQLSETELLPNYSAVSN